MKIISVTVCGIFQVDVKVNNPKDNSEVLLATQEVLDSLNITLLNQHNDISPIFFTGGLDMSDVVVSNQDEDEDEE